MNFHVSLFTIIVVLIVGLYDIAIAINRRNQQQKGPLYAYSILGALFTIFGIYLLIVYFIR